jgi:hypothetical protein
MSALANAKAKREAYLAEIRQEKAAILSEIIEGIKALNEMGGHALKIGDKAPKPYAFSLSLGLYNVMKPHAAVAEQINAMLAEAGVEADADAADDDAAEPAPAQPQRQRGNGRAVVRPPVN